MFIYQIVIEYDGTDFVGWQKQKNGHSIQQTVEKILTKILKEKVILYGSGRTDAGVHAVGQSAHFVLKSKIDNNFIFLNSINFFLYKKKISILEVNKNILDGLEYEYDKLEIWHADYKLEINYIYKKFINMIKNTKIVMNTSYEDIYTEFVYMLYYSYHKENIHIKD